MGISYIADSPGYGCHTLSYHPAENAGLFVGGFIMYGFFQNGVYFWMSLDGYHAEYCGIRVEDPNKSYFEHAVFERFGIIVNFANFQTVNSAPAMGGQLQPCHV